MKQFLLLLLLFSLSWCTTNACLNEYYHADPFRNEQLDLKSLLPSVPGSVAYWYHPAEPENTLLTRLDSLTGVLQQRPHDFRLQSDIAALKLKGGDRSDAVFALLEQLYAAHPNEYNIVINLATACELNNDNARALELLKEAIALSPGSHYGSEWIHIKILEQKIAVQPDYALVTGLGIQNFPAWLTDRDYKFPESADSLKLQLAYQLHERTYLYAAPDAIIGRLAIDFADIVAKTVSYNEAIPFYDFSAGYAPSLKPLADARKQGLQHAQKEASGTLRSAALIWGIPLLFIAFIVMAWIRNRKKQG